MWRTIFTLLGAAGMAYAGLCAWLFATQRSQIYYRTPESSAAGATALWLDSGGERLKVWVQERPGQRAVVYFGGNAEDVAMSLAELELTSPGRALFLMNYRGYGGSSGEPTETGIHADALALFDLVRERHSQVALVGRSLGSAVAVHVASERDVDRLVLITPFDSFASVGAAHFPIFPVRLLLRDRYDAASRAARVRAPVLAVIAGEDEIIPRASAEALVAALPPGAVRTVVIEGAMHNTVSLAPGCLDAIRGFMQADVPPQNSLRSPMPANQAVPP
jgi:pimeloyl-ACP methyl ester carboxylesterase